MFADADGDALTYAAAAQHPALLGVSLSGERRVKPQFAGHRSSTRVRRKSTTRPRDAYGGSVTRSATFIGITAKESPGALPRTPPPARPMGDPVTGTPYNNVALSYTLKGNAADSGKFVIDAASGQISVKQGATLDYETDDSHREIEYWQGEVFAKFYRGEVQYTVDSLTSAITVLLKVTDVEAGQPGAPTVTRTEFSEPTNPALDVSWTAADANGLTITGYEAQYRKKAAAGEDPAAWTSFTGTVDATNRTLTLPDLGAGATYEVQVRALTSLEGPSDWSTTGSGRANRPPRSTEPANLQPSYTVLWGGDDLIRTLNDKFADDDGDTLTYAASAQYPGVLRVGIEGENSDKLRIHALNPATSTVTYAVSDAYGGYASKTIDVSGSADSFNGADLSRNVAENSAAGTAVGDPVTGTPFDDGDDQTNDALTYTLTGEAATSGAFVIDSATGQISVKQGATIDYETKTSYTGRVNWTVQEPGSLRRRHHPGDRHRGRQARYARGDAHGIQRADQPGAGRDLDGRGRQRPHHHRLRGAVPQEGRPWRASRHVDGLQRHAGRHGDQPDPAQPRRRRHLRSPGARRHVRGSHRPLVGHRVGPGQPAAAEHRTGQPPAQLHRPVGRRRPDPNTQ